MKPMKSVGYERLAISNKTGFHQLHDIVETEDGAIYSRFWLATYSTGLPPNLILMYLIGAWLPKRTRYMYSTCVYVYS